MIKYMTFFVLQLKDCFGFGGFMGYLCLRDVLSTCNNYIETEKEGMRLAQS